MTFKTVEEATRKARDLVEYHRYELTICELHETAGQYWTKPLEDIIGIDTSGLN